jgi:ribosome biogenesis protein BRX1
MSTNKRRKLISGKENKMMTEEDTADVMDDDDEQVSDEDDNKLDNNDMENIKTTPLVSDGRYHNKQRCLTLCSRGVTARYRHLLEDLRVLMPHHKKESKLDVKNDAIGKAVTDICVLRNCNTVLFLECRKRQDAYLWMGRIGPNQPGPSVKFHVTNIHTMDELRLTGNCMKHSRPILSFDTNFHTIEHLKLLKEIFTDIFGIPRGHPKSKPFVDRVMAFYYGDNRVREHILHPFFLKKNRTCL